MAIHNINTILIIGSTSGIGEAFTRNFHGMGKKVIAVGRRADRLEALKKDMSGLQTYESLEWDITDLASLSKRASEILRAHPALDTVFINAGIQKSFSFLDSSTSSSSEISAEIISNLTSPILLTRLFVPHLVSLATKGTAANLIITSSALAYVPFGFYPVYCPTKAAIHSFCLTLRQQLNSLPHEVQENLAVVELVPPYVDTELDAEHRALVTQMQGGEEKAFKPMPLNEYVEKALSGLNEQEGQNHFRKEVGVGFAQSGIDAWRGSLGQVLIGMGIDC